MMHRWRTSRAGATLVEVVVAILILGILAVAGAAAVHLARGMAAVQKSRRLALEAANSRLEEVRAAPYLQVRPPALNYAVYYLRVTTGVWAVNASDPNETVLINDIARPMQTTVQYLDTDGGSASYDALRVAVRVQYAAAAESAVLLETVKAP